MTLTARERTNRDMLRVRDLIDRDYASALDLDTMARLVHVSPDHLIRTFRSVFGETPHRYLQRRRVERSISLLRDTERPIIDVCLAVGFTSLGTFGRTFRSVVGESPSECRRRGPLPPAPGCFTMAWNRPSTFSTSISEKPDAAVYP